MGLGPAEGAVFVILHTAGVRSTAVCGGSAATPAAVAAGSARCSPRAAEIAATDAGRGAAGGSSVAVCAGAATAAAAGPAGAEGSGTAAAASAATGLGVVALEDAAGRGICVPDPAELDGAFLTRTRRTACLCAEVPASAPGPVSVPVGEVGTGDVAVELPGECRLLALLRLPPELVAAVGVSVAAAALAACRAQNRGESNPRQTMWWQECCSSGVWRKQLRLPGLTCRCVNNQPTFCPACAEAAVGLSAGFLPFLLPPPNTQLRADLASTAAMPRDRTAAPVNSTAAFAVRPATPCLPSPLRRHIFGLLLSCSSDCWVAGKLLVSWMVVTFSPASDMGGAVMLTGRLWTHAI